MEVWKIIFLSKLVIYRFHVNLPGCTWRIIAWLVRIWKTTGINVFIQYIRRLLGICLYKASNTHLFWGGKEMPKDIMLPKSCMGLRSVSSARRWILRGRSYCTEKEYGSITSFKNHLKQMFPRLCVDLLRKPFSLKFERWEFLCWFQLTSDVILLSGNENTVPSYIENIS